MERLSISQINRLGGRLRQGSRTEADLRLLDEYRRSFDPAFVKVINIIRAELGLEPTGRPQKTTDSIVGKLIRERTRLSQMQDIAGCRIVVGGGHEVQDEARAALERLFPNAIVIDRRQQSSHGYRAVHVIVTVEGKKVEVQVRTYFQQLWAQFSEKMADTWGQAVKYGVGPADAQRLVLDLSERVKRLEDEKAYLYMELKRIEILIAESESHSQESTALWTRRQVLRDSYRDTSLSLGRLATVFKEEIDRLSARDKEE